MPGLNRGLNSVRRPNAKWTVQPGVDWVRMVTGGAGFLPRIKSAMPGDRARLRRPDLRL